MWSYPVREKLRSREAAMPFIMIAVLIDMAAIGVIVPVLPTLVASFATDQADQAFWYGVVAAAFGLAGLASGPKILKTVGTPSSFRAGAANFMAG